MPPQQRALVIGSSGFVGRALVQHLIDAGYAVTGFDATPDADLSGDVSKFGEVDHAVQRVRPHLIFHLAAQSHVAACDAHPREAFHVNVDGTLNVLESVRLLSTRRPLAPTPRIVIAGSGEEYGHGLAHTPDDRPAPINFYGATKAVSTLLAETYVRVYKQDVSVARFSNIYGPGQDARKFIPLAINKFLRGEVLQLNDGGRTLRNWLYIDDACRALMLLATKKNTMMRVFNVVGDAYETLHHTADRLHRIASEIAPDAVAASTIKVLVSDTYEHPVVMRATAFGFTPRVSLNDGLHSTVLSMLPPSKG
jgi:dTDP-glucose 4,6-dehydratase